MDATNMSHQVRASNCASERCLFSYARATALSRDQANQPVGSANKKNPALRPMLNSHRPPASVPAAQAVNLEPSSGARPKTNSPARVMGATPRTASLSKQMSED